MATTLTTPAVWTGERVRVADVARHLRELRDSAGDGPHTTVTSVMNLVAWTPNQDVAEEVEAVVDALTDHHPSRAVIAVPAAGGDGIDARVEVMSLDHGSGQRTLVVEQIILTLHGAVAAHAGSVVIPLLRSELPTFLWWPAAPDPGSPTFAELVRVADRLVTETGRELRGAEAVTRLADVVASAHAPVTDLAWAVLTPWRQILASAMRGEPLLRLRTERAAAVVTCRTGTPSLESQLLGGWLTDTIGEHLELQCREDDGSDDILGVRLEAGGTCVVELTLDPGSRTTTLATAIGGPRTIPMPAPDRRELLAGELELRGHDRTFERALSQSARRPAG